MDKEEKQPENNAEESTSNDYEAQIAKLESQIDNLNKGVASTRDEAKAAKEQLQATRDELAQLKAEKEKVDDEEVQLSPEDEKKFEAWVKKKGFVTEDQMQKERERLQADSFKSIENTAVAEFLEKHPEYDDDEKWEQVKQEFSLYRTPTDLAGYRKLLLKIHKDLGGDDTKEKARAEARAEITKRNALKRGGKGSSAAGDSKDMEADIDEMQDKYPSLSREQIVARLNEMRALYEDKK